MRTSEVLVSLVSFNYKWYSECENYIVNYKYATFHYCIIITC